ncbi:hypothetical protein WS67_04855 [Burkholderia singularis]|uniref:Uncharacterized protein n=1 Tax=Burkholderia singularis TaxID=1503053 RepID=A0A103E7J1_9BURK|nr:hypothetical protein WS67_04855 [Burkholderia singularis]
MPLRQRSSGSGIPPGRGGRVPGRTPKNAACDAARSARRGCGTAPSHASSNANAGTLLHRNAPRHSVRGRFWI